MAKSKGGYVDGFVLVVPKKNVAAYRRMATRAGKIWKKYGALDFKECIGDDLHVKMGPPFSRLAKLKRGDEVFFSFIVYKSRKHRDAVNAKVMNDPWIKKSMKIMEDPKKQPHDPKRMSYGGFKVLVSA